MKKIILGLLCALALIGVVGCDKEAKKVDLDLEKIKTSLDGLTGEEFYVFGVPKNIDALKLYNNLEDLYENDLKEIFKLDDSILEQYFVRYDKKTNEFYAILKAKDGKKDDVKSIMDTYSNTASDKIAYEEYNGYLIYARSNNNNLVLKTIKESKTPIFGAMSEITKEQMKDVLGLDPSLVSEFVMKSPMMIVQSNTYIVVKPAEGKEEEVKTALDAYMVKLEEQWKTYLPAQYELVKNRKVEKVGDYLVYVVSSNNDLVFNTIKNTTK